MERGQQVLSASHLSEGAVSDAAAGESRARWSRNLSAIALRREE